MGKIMHQGVNYSSINDAEHLSNLQDTQISNPADGNILQYDGNTNKWKNAVAQEHTTFNGRSGSILPMAGDYTAEDITYRQSTVKNALDNIGNSVVKTFNGRNGSVLPTAGDYDATQINYDNNTTVKQKIDSLTTGVSSFNNRTGAITPTAGDYDATQVNYSSNQTIKQKIDSLVTGVSSFNNRTGTISPTSGDYNYSQVRLSSAMHIGEGTQTNVAQALNALANNSGGQVMVNNLITGQQTPLTKITISTSDPAEDYIFERGEIWLTYGDPT